MAQDVAPISSDGASAIARGGRRLAGFIPNWKYADGWGFATRPGHRNHRLRDEKKAEGFSCAALNYAGWPKRRIPVESRPVLRLDRADRRGPNFAT
jgi:hypothetical protein